MAQKNSKIDPSLWQDIDETSLPKNVAAKQKAAREAYETHKKAQNDYFDALKSAFKAQGVIGDGQTMLISRMAWGALRGAVVAEEAATPRAAAKAKAAFKLTK